VTDTLPSAETYELLRTLTSPVVAVTSRRGDKLNGMISDGAVRASIVPDVPRLGVFIHKFNYSHDLIWETGRFCLHVLHAGQADVVHRLGFFSGRDRDKLADIPHRSGPLELPVLEDCYAWFACEVGNVMDTGSSTFFMGEVRATGRGPGREVLEPAALRAGLPADVIRDYMAKLGAAQDAARTLSATMQSAYTRK
jgi:flavin reductase (DIM6/NTAB) family NADH-FMN oxidoreductase RutF